MGKIDALIGIGTYIDNISALDLFFILTLILFIVIGGPLASSVILTKLTAHPSEPFDINSTKMIPLPNTYVDCCCGGPKPQCFPIYAVQLFLMLGPWVLIILIAHYGISELYEHVIKPRIMKK